MEKREIFIIAIVSLVILIFFLYARFTGYIVKEDEFPTTKEMHWTHMPLTYSIANGCDNQKIEKAINKLQAETNYAVSFKRAEKNADIEITCSYLKNCYENKTERRWFWLITTEAICEHETGSTKITKIKRNRIMKAKIQLTIIKEKQDNCTETEAHELLHAFGYNHSQNNESIMYPERKGCNEDIDSDIVNDLIKKYKK